MKLKTWPLTQDANYLQTVGRSLEVLELIGSMPGLTLSETVRQTGMSTTVAYRLLFTLAAAGFLQQEPEGKRYFLGDKALLLGFQAIDTREIKRISLHFMWDFYERTGANCILTVPCANRSLCVEKVGSLRDNTNAVRVGSLYPLHQGASNRALLAFMPRREQQSYLNGLCLPPDDREAIERALELAAANGYDYSIGLLTPGRFGLGFPLFDRRRRLVGVLSTGGYSNELTDDMLAERTRQLGQVASQINLATGAPSIP